MKRRPAALLFLCALLGAFFGGEYSFAHGFWLFAMFLPLLLMVIPVNLCRIVGLLSFTFFITAFSTAIEKDSFLTAIAELPSAASWFVGRIIEAKKKEDGTIVALAHVHEEHRHNAFTVNIRLKDAAAAFTPKAGQTIRFKGEITPNRAPLSKAHFDTMRYGLVHGIHGSVTLENNYNFHLVSIKNPPYFPKTRETFRQRLLAALTPREASLLLALMIGETALFSEEQNEIYQSIGAQHLLAVSGLQVTIIAALCFFFLMPLVGLMLPRRYAHRAQLCAAVVTVVLTFCFVGLSGFTSSALRAFLMASVMLVPTFLTRKIDIFDAFFVVSLSTMLVKPTSAMDLGYLLSYAAVFGLIVAHHRSGHIKKRLQAYSTSLALVFSLVITSMAAFLATMPIIAVYFSTVAPLSIFTNLILVPIASVLQIPAIVFGLTGCLLNWAPLITLAAYFSNAIEIFAEFLSQICGGIIYLPTLPTPAMLFIFIAILLIFFTLLKPSKTLAITALLLLGWPLSQWVFRKPRLEVTVIPVGQGDSTLFSLPSGHNLLVDAGGNMFKDFDPGQRIVLPTLKRKGVRQLDVLVISHPDPDHINGAFSILDGITVKEIWHSGYRPDHPLTKQLIELAHRKNIPIKETADLLGDHNFGLTNVQVVAPITFGQDSYFSELRANDNSLVLRIVSEGHALLWPGDIEYFGENLLISSKVRIDAAILKAPHHGSKTSSSDELIQAVKPEHVIYSTGPNNRFHFPHKEVVERYKSHGVTQWNTATEGEITITIDEGKILITNFVRPLKIKREA